MHVSSPAAVALCREGNAAPVEGLLCQEAFQNSREGQHDWSGSEMLGHWLVVFVGDLLESSSHNLPRR